MSFWKTILIALVVSVVIQIACEKFVNRFLGDQLAQEPRRQFANKLWWLCFFSFLTGIATEQYFPG